MKMKEWKNNFEYWFYETNKSSFDLNEKTPSDWILSIENVSARLSWDGRVENGNWQFTSPIIAQSVAQDIEWLPTNCVKLENAQVYVEKKLYQALILMRDEITSSIDALTHNQYKRIVDGKEVLVSTAQSL